MFSLDVYELIERCAAIVCNLNGRVPDEGMIVETLLACAAGKTGEKQWPDDVLNHEMDEASKQGS